MITGSSRPSYRQVCRALDSIGYDYKTFDLNKDYFIIISAASSRIFGPFKNEEASGILWANPLLASDSEEMKGWNIGGDRIWISPEVQFLCTDRQRFIDTLIISREMDPGNYCLSSNGSECVLHGDMRIQSYNLCEGTKNLHIKISIRNCLNPLRELESFADIMDDIIYCGYEHDICLSEKENNGIRSAIWNVAPVIPCGTAYMGTTGKAEYIDYFDTGFNEQKKHGFNRGIAEITGDFRYKVGFKSATLNGRYAYHGRHDDLGPYLIIKNFMNSPSWEYMDESPSVPGMRGYSTFIYNNNDELEKFGEIECISQSLGMNKNMSDVQTQIQTWFFIGNNKKLNDILQLLIGFEL